MFINIEPFQGSVLWYIACDQAFLAWLFMLNPFRIFRKFFLFYFGQIFAVKNA